MKIKIILTGLFLLLFTLVSRSNSIVNQRLQGFCKVWGLLKYYHPTIQSGKIDWDSVFVVHFKKIINTKSEFEYNIVINEFIRLPGPIQPLKKPYLNFPKDSSFNTFDFAWINSYPLFTDQNRTLLNGVIQNYVPRENVYFKKEVNQFYRDRGKDLYYVETKRIPDSANAMLGFSRYWNAVNYLFAYKHLMDDNWDSVLLSFTPRILTSADSPQYYIILAEVASKTNDCHSYYDNYLFNITVGPVKSLLDSWPYPLATKFIENKTVVVKVRSSIYKKYALRPGDIITSINGVSIKFIRDSLSRFCGCSTPSSVDREIDKAIFQSFFASSYNPLNIEILDSNYVNRGITLEWTPTEHDEWIGYRCDTAMRIIQDSILYLDLWYMNNKEVKRALRKYRYVKAIILDGRKGHIGGVSLPLTLRLPNKNKSPFAVYYIADPKFPGAFTKKTYRTNMLGLRLFHRKYKGKVIFLTSVHNQSSDEFQLMQLKSDFNVTLIGEPTSGTDGVASSFLIEPTALTYITTDAVTYPDGRTFQRSGLLPDIQVSPTIHGIRNWQDEILMRAIQFANTGK